MLIGAALVLGGSSRDSGFFPLFLVSLGIAGFSLFRWWWRDTAQFDWWLLALLLGWAAIVLVQVAPLPPVLSAGAPGRGSLWDATALIGASPAWRPISLAPKETLSAILFAVPAGVLAISLGRANKLPVRPAFLTVSMIAVLSALIGIAQAQSGMDSPLYFHEITNRYQAVGFFANANHLASLLLVSVPLLAAVLSDRRASAGFRRFRVVAILSWGTLTGIAIVFTESAAGMLLLAPTMAASLAVALPGLRPLLAAAGLLTIAAAAGLIAMQWNAIALPLPTNLGEDHQSRVGIARTALAATEAYWPVGSGLGTFEVVYRMFEDPNVVTNIYINHAHNDYLEWVMETGIAGVVLILVLWTWWGQSTLKAWRGPDDEDATWARGASIATGVLLLHSLVDYPLRTPALLAVFTLCAMVMSSVQAEAARKPSGPQPSPGTD